MRNEINTVLRSITNCPLQMIEEYAEALLKEGANPLEGDVVAIVAKKGPQFSHTAKHLGRHGVEQLKHQKKLGWSMAVEFFAGLLISCVHQDVVSIYC